MSTIIQAIQLTTSDFTLISPDLQPLQHFSNIIEPITMNNNLKPINPEIKPEVSVVMKQQTPLRVFRSEHNTLATSLEQEINGPTATPVQQRSLTPEDNAFLSTPRPMVELKAPSVVDLNAGTYEENHLLNGADSSMGPASNLKPAVVEPSSSLSPPRYPCSFCGNSYSLQSSLARHVKHRHEKRIPFSSSNEKCEHCSNRFPNKYILNWHMKTSHKDMLAYLSCATSNPQKGDGAYTCNICSEEISGKPHLVSHMSTFHNEIALFTEVKQAGTDVIKHPFLACELCTNKNAFYSNPASLKRHKSTVHNVGNVSAIHECKLCNSKYLHSSSLSRHMKHEHPQSYKNEA